MAAPLATVQPPTAQLGSKAAAAGSLNSKAICLRGLGIRILRSGR